MLVLLADHLIPDNSVFVADVFKASALARKGQLVTFGIHPTGPDTGFGYIEVAKVSADPQQVIKFVEKPDLATAQEYLSTGRFYWNSGMFCFAAGTFLDALKLHAPDVFDAADETMATAQCQPGLMRFNSQAFGQQPDISIDYAVMERASNVSLIPAKFGWSDVGAWPSVADAHAADANGNTLACEEPIDWVAIKTTGTHVHVDSHGHKRVVATVGLKDVIIVHTPDALLVADKKHAQDVKKVVDALKQRHIDSAQHQSTLMPSSVNRPWGTYTTLKEENGYKVKRITVRPGQSLSLQYHHRRSEHWVVVRGKGLVQVGDVEYPTGPGEYRYIPLKETHRLTNTGEEELVLIEVQCGDYLGEDDIVRLADIYGRT
jgi:mannose-1-phosphate guanylyltransferase